MILESVLRIRNRVRHDHALSQIERAPCSDRAARRRRCGIHQRSTTKPRARELGAHSKRQRRRQARAREIEPRPPFSSASMIAAPSTVSETNMTILLRISEALCTAAKVLQCLGDHLYNVSTGEKLSDYTNWVHTSPRWSAEFYQAYGEQEWHRKHPGKGGPTIKRERAATCAQCGRSMVYP